MCTQMKERFQSYEALHSGALKAIAKSQYPAAHGLAKNKLEISMTYFKGAVKAYAESNVESSGELLTLASASLAAAREEIDEQAARDQKMVDKIYRDKPGGAHAYL